ncbi:MAG: DmsE family decaheme c-type cytochrome [Alphaproteobacteria bacterium]|nr:DmsE family decaheme c-type cytochrome [Alphaproteobacteria bacterium]
MDFCCRLILSGCLAATLSFFVFVFSLGAQQTPAAGPPGGARVVSAADKDCLQCHGPKSDQPVGDIGVTKHGTATDRRTPDCRSCHGDSGAHIADPKAAKTDIQYHAKSSTEPAKQNGQCLACHRGGHMILWPGSPHQSQEVTCGSCHKMHTPRDPVMTKTQQTQVCTACHKQQHVQLKKPSRHPIVEGKVRCSDCHNPHGSAGPALMARDTVNGTCFKCHAEKRGPFIWNHQPVTENCALCHEPHGSTVASMLKWRQPFLCQQCHEITSHRGAIPSLTAPGTTTGIGSTLARSCVNCHTNIHGSNNPTNSAGSRSFRR